MTKFKPVDPRVEFPKLEEQVLAYWRENKIFEKSIEKDAPKGAWTFLDGPPFITGLPHYGSLLSSIPKDVFPRFKTMQGYRVRRVWGWDCHGLPAENKVENKLGIKRKKDIEEKVGVKKFIDECKLYVKEVSGEWEWYVDHVGRWVDFKNAYKTMDLPYMESVMWVFKQMYDKDLIYKGLRVSLYCPHCSTPISNFEVAMDTDNYKEIVEPGTVYKYELAKEKNTYLLAWSTTPWTKLVTPALAVNPSILYVKVQQENEYYILAKSRLATLKEDLTYNAVEEFLGEKLIDQEFIPHYDFYDIAEGKRAFVVVGGDFVSEDEGTGIVTLAAYGEEDLEVMKRENIVTPLHLDEEGKFKQEVPNWAGQYYLDVNDDIDNDLAGRGLIYRQDPYMHTIPTCWRCHTRLIYAPQDAWYVNVQSLKEEMKRTNEDVNWFPEHFKHGRFEKSLEAAPDWCISRSRYWGSPVPVWECESCGERVVPGSIKELEKLSGEKVTDLHKPEIDEVVITCAKCGSTARRVPEVLDSWIEAGSASFAERHFPFEPELRLEEFFPPDFIIEYTGQIRAWFYVLHVISNALYQTHSFRNVLVTGVILGTDGRKMSKNFGNYPDPKGLLQEYGGDALRLYLMGSPVMNGEDIRISEEDYRNQVKGFLRTLWNVYNFFVTSASVSEWTDSDEALHLSTLDDWILSRLNKNTKAVTKYLEEYNTAPAVRALKDFIVEDVSTWYIRRSRDRAMEPEFLATCHTVLTTFCRLCAPIVPFIAEEMYKNLTDEESVHLADYPVAEGEKINERLEEEMNLVRRIVSLGHAERKKSNIPVRQPLAKITVHAAKVENIEVLNLLLEDLNVKEYDWIKSDHEEVELDTVLTPELEEEGKARELARSIQEERKNLGVALDEGINVTAPWIPVSPELVEWVKRRTLARKLVLGDVLKVSK